MTLKTNTQCPIKNLYYTKKRHREKFLRTRLALAKLNEEGDSQRKKMMAYDMRRQTDRQI